ncbi:hypothetical protein DL95DRAFT_528376 [Leptodontidium sp. 2 PMI_412]|nr:hypothetical protein DL95DRAFT_528376 [Leptodontidium sp. 2 PMI_412]
MRQQQFRKPCKDCKRKSPKPKQATPKTLKMAETVAFANFTPDDKKKIMTGVAPSGSSKTKARREKKEIEKRKSHLAAKHSLADFAKWVCCSVTMGVWRQAASSRVLSILDIISPIARPVLGVEMAGTELLAWYRL